MYLSPVTIPASSFSSYLSIVLLVGVIFAGCGQSEKSDTTSEDSLREEITLNRQDSTKLYKFDIRLPAIIRTNSTLRDTLTKITDAQTQDFVKSTEKDSVVEAGPHPWQLKVDYQITDSTDQFIAVFGEGYTYTGGAHGMPFHITLNYDPNTSSFVELQDIVRDSTALAPIADRARLEIARYVMEADGSPVRDESSLQQYVNKDQWLREGSEPMWSNYSNVLFQPEGIRIIFGAYQVGPYAIGTPDVEVPASVFIDQLKPEYSNWFESTR